MSLSKNTLSGFIWTLTSRIGTRLLIILVGVVLARLLTPADFGLVAMLSIFFAISGSLVDSGFTSALIRKKVLIEDDKSTAFFINLAISIFLYVVLWVSAGSIARFFNQPDLLWLTRVMGLDIIFKALGIVQRSVLTHSMRFKLLSIVEISSSFLTGGIAIFLAYKGFGVWALAIKYFLSSLFVTIAFWYVNPWIPKGFIKRESFQDLFGFGSKVMLTGLLNTFYKNIYNLIIGKFFSPMVLGLYNRAFTLTSQAVSSIYAALQYVTYPVLSKTRDDPMRLKSAFRKIVLSVSFINFPLAVFMGFSAEPVVLLLLGVKWKGTISFMHLLAASVLVNHISSINQNLFKVLGRSDLYLKISIYNSCLGTVAIAIGFYFGIWGLVFASVISQYVEVLLAMLMTSKQINYSFKEQLNDILSVGVLLVPLIAVFVFIRSLNIDSLLLNIALMAIAGTAVYLLTAIKAKSSALFHIRHLYLERGNL